MSVDPPPLPPTPNPPREQRDWFSNALSAIRTSASFLALAAKEWLPSLLDQPIQPPMEYNAAFEDEWGRISRLITIVIVISSLLLGGLNIFTGKVDLSDTLKSAFIAIIIAVLLALIYRPFAYICGVRLRPSGVQTSPLDSGQIPSQDLEHRDATTYPVLTMRQIVFVELYTFVPWLPIFAFIYGTVSVVLPGEIRDFLLLAPYVCSAYILINFAKAVRLITNCSWPRIWLSLSAPVVFWLLEVVPLVIVILYLLYSSLFGSRT